MAHNWTFHFEQTIPLYPNIKYDSGFSYASQSQTTATTTSTNNVMKFVLQMHNLWQWAFTSNINIYFSIPISLKLILKINLQSCIWSVYISEQYLSYSIQFKCKNEVNSKYVLNFPERTVHLWIFHKTWQWLVLWTGTG